MEENVTTLTAAQFSDIIHNYKFVILSICVGGGLYVTVRMLSETFSAGYDSKYCSWAIRSNDCSSRHIPQDICIIGNVYRCKVIKHGNTFENLSLTTDCMPEPVNISLQEKES